jgi:hypothetical protein
VLTESILNYTLFVSANSATLAEGLPGSAPPPPYQAGPTQPASTAPPAAAVQPSQVAAKPVDGEDLDEDLDDEDEEEEEGDSGSD